ncbi:hypothetical protein N7527_008595 [Penicillium freii]|nr:hypothetical protein N7527_008595 [Penicillium freii]
MRSSISSIADHDYAILHLTGAAVGEGVTAIALPGDAINPDETSRLPVRVAGWDSLASSDKTVLPTLHQPNMLTVDRVLTGIMTTQLQRA